MKFSAVFALAFAAVAYANVETANYSQQNQAAGYSEAAEYDIGGLLQKAGPILKKLMCALPCIDKSANKIKPKDQGLVDAACENIDKINKGAGSCLKKCSISPDARAKGVQAAKNACKKRETGDKGDKGDKGEKSEKY